MCKFVFLTDLHLGKGRIDAMRIRSNLETYLYPQLTSAVDMLILGGDFFDALISMDSQAGLVAQHIIRELHYIAAQNQILIRGVRGTFLHDRNQIRHLMVMAKGFPDKLHGTDLVRLYDTMQVEHFPTLGITILFLPAELPGDDMLGQAAGLLHKNQLDQVDAAVHHGFLTHLLPRGLPHPPPNTYHRSEFAKLVKGPVFNGHVHRPDVTGNVVNGGSFERLNHAEEEPKGFYVVDYDPPSGIATFEFIENRGALNFLTFDLSSCQDLTEGVRQLSQWLDHQVVNLTPPLFVRVIAPDVKFRQALRKGITLPPDTTLEIVTKRETLGPESATQALLSYDSLPTLTPDNLPAAIVEFLAQRGITLTEQEVTEALTADE